MGWTHDYRDVAREHSYLRGRLSARRAEQRVLRDHPHPEMGIPRILRRRARWVGARLRHQRG
ncbi:hypothetical protein LHJ74_08240 [Streptomyces sp. N2-109]|uniref:Uncharacterized protein n=1 Tax=Streptomyces gossypii TaxID=2883101 RepID=A0ABT2JPU8_9ACTN|nr:hypothetical protein [Streptomyces gossypii]MCT2589902.1 hypothetical protein [Streptomyces gossypii]